MSGAMEDGDVILIAPEADNQDGSQTFYILDPCPSEECTDEPPEIELVDLTAEVKDTGAIALLSTNSSTGALEITLKKKKDKIKAEDMETSSDANRESEEIITDDDLIVPVKDEDEEVDVEEISLHDAHVESDPSEQQSESQVTNLDLSEDDQLAQQEKDDEAEEGALYIDDARYSELQEELAQDQNESFKDFIIDENGTVTEVCESEDEKPDIAAIGCDSSYEEIDNSVEEKGSECDENLLGSIIDDRNNGNKDAHMQEAFIHGQLIKIPTEKNVRFEKSTDIESVESTDTALTLLELAGGKLYRNNMEMEVSVIEQDVIPPQIDYVMTEELQPMPENAMLITLPSMPESEPSTLSMLQPGSEPSTLSTLQSEPEPTISPTLQCVSEPSLLTSLNPVPVEAPLTSVDEKSAATPKPLPQIKPDVSSTQKLSGNNKACQDLVQRLKEGDTPMLGPRGQFKNLTSPIVTQNEIAQEILERSLQKCPYTEPSGGDVIFAMKIAHRLATRIVTPDKPEIVPSESNTPAAGNNTPTTTKTPNSKTVAVNKPLQKSNAISDKIELLKILEDDPDDIPSLDQSQMILEKTKVKKKNRASPLIKLHPELEKELALKQLQDFTQRKKKVVFSPDVYKNAKQEKESLEKHQEHNNNLNSKNNQAISSKRRSNELFSKSVKKMKKDELDSETVTADPSQITETLTVEGQSLASEQLKDGKSLKQYSNKKLSRSSETPPRDVPIEILLNGVDDDVDGKDVSKNKIFKATNPRKRQEELKRKRQKHFANVLQRVKPQKKRGRPAKKKPAPLTDDMLNKEFLLMPNIKQNKPKNGLDKNHADVSSEDAATSSKNEKIPKSKKMREIERLLGDEGAINMLYSVEQKRTTGSEPKRGMLPSYRRKKKDLILKTKLVKSAVLRLTTNPPQSTGRVSLRGQAAKDEENEENTDGASLRKMSVDSHDSLQSVSSPPAETFPFPAKIVPAEASRIIRRHSSSSNYSSRSNSPRRLSVDGERINIVTPETKATEVGQGDAPVPSVNKQSKQEKVHQSPAVKKLSERAARLLKEKCKELNLDQERSKQLQTLIDSKKSAVKTPPVKLENKTKSKVQLKSQLKVDPVKTLGRPRRTLMSHDDVKKRAALSTTLAAAVDDFTKENENVDENIPVETPKMSALPVVPSPGGNKRTATHKVAVYKKGSASPTPTRLRAAKTSVVYNELTLKRHNHLVEIILAPVSTNLKNAFNTTVLRELISVLNGLAKDNNCRVVLFTSSDNVFCQGIDFFALIQPTAEKRTKAALELAVAIKDYIKALAMFSKPVVAGVQGAAVGLGTTMLPLFDLVFASDTATFHTPYAKLGQVPEGAATLTLPTLLGSAATSELLFACRKLTAAEALHFGLVTRILPGDSFHDDLRPIVNSMASQSSQSMDATKALLRHNLLTGLETTLVSETHLLIQHWTGTECQANFNMYLQDKEHSLDLTLQKQPT